jgi:hypothetical protein
MISSDTLKNIRITAIHKIYEIIKNCKGFIFVDADISDISLKFIKYVRNDFIFIENLFKHNKNVEAEEITNEEEFINLIKKDKKYFICCDHKSSADLLHKKLDGIKNNIKIITSDTKDNELNLNDYDKIIYSPKIIYGLDCVNFHNVYCYYHEDTINAKSMIQQIARTRNIKKLRFIFLLKKFNNKYDIEYNELKNNISNRSEQGEKIINKKLNDEYIELNKIYLNLLTDYEYNNYAYKTNMRKHFIILLETRGFNVSYDNKKNILLDKKKEKIIKDEIIDNKLDNFIYDDSNYKQHKIKNMLKIPDGREDDYKYFFINNNCVNNALSYNTIFKDYDEILIMIKKIDDFTINILNKSIIKINFLNQLKIIEDDKNILNINHKNNIKLEDEHMKVLNNLYNTIMQNNKDVKKIKNINFNCPYERNKTHYEIINKIFHSIDGEKPFNKIQIMQNGKRQYNYILNNDFFKPLKEIYNFMNADKNKFKKKIKTKRH